MTQNTKRVLTIAVACLLSMGVSACGKYGKPVRSDATATGHLQNQPTTSQSLNA